MPEQTNPAPAKSKLWLAIVLLAMVAGAGIFVWLRTQASSSAADSVAPESALSLETFVVNIGSGQRAYLRVGITLGLGHPPPGGKAEGATLAVVRDTVLGILAAGQADDLVKTEGKQKLKDQLLKALQEKAPQLAVVNVYFTEFLVQM